MTQTARTLDTTVTKRIHLDYLLHLPAGHDESPHRLWPLILFLHGAGERGNDIQAVAKYGVPHVAAANADFPFVAVSPQCPASTVWDDHLDEVMELLSAVRRDWPVDAERIYLTGLSMGGFGAWLLGCLHPEVFAAIVPICGGGLPMRGFPARVAALKSVPVWAFHGALDQSVRVEESQRMVAALQAAGGTAKLTIYPDAAHDSWTRTYENPDLYTWLLDQRRPATSA